MAKIGDRITTPESGWVRFDDTHENFLYTGGWSAQSNPDAYKGAYMRATKGEIIRFNFTGVKLRVITVAWNSRHKNNKILIDGEEFIVDTSIANQFQTLVFEVTGLENKEHFVEYLTGDNGTYADWDAIDIEEGEEILPYDENAKPPAINKILLLSEEGKHKIINANRFKDNLIPYMTSNTSPKGIVDASGFRATGTEPWRAFNGIYTGDSSETWQSNTTTGWLSYEFDSEILVDGYGIRCRNDFASTRPVDWKFEAFNGSEWIVLDVIFGESWTGYQGEFRYYSFNNPVKYKKYRINVSKHGGSNFLSIAELQMFKGKTSTTTFTNDYKISYIDHGMSPKELSEIDLSSDFTEKQYVQDQSTPLGEGKVFEQPLNVDKVIKSVKIT